LWGSFVSADVPEGLADVPEGLADVPEHLADVPERLADVPEGLADVPERLADVPPEERNGKRKTENGFSPFSFPPFSLSPAPHAIAFPLQKQPAAH
jgi:hypothetical protein